MARYSTDSWTPIQGETCHATVFSSRFHRLQMGGQYRLPALHHRRDIIGRLSSRRAQPVLLEGSFSPHSPPARTQIETVELTVDGTRSPNHNWTIGWDFLMWSACSQGVIPVHQRPEVRCSSCRYKRHNLRPIFFYTGKRSGWDSIRGSCWQPSAPSFWRLGSGVGACLQSRSHSTSNLDGLSVLFS